MTDAQQKIYERYAGIQTFLTEGCLFFSLCSIAEEARGKPVDLLGAYTEAKRRGWIESNNDMTEWSQCQLLEWLTGHKWSRKARSWELGMVADKEFTVEKWQWRRGFHFRRRYVDTLVNSQTVKNGKLVGWYLYVKED